MMLILRWIVSIIGIALVAATGLWVFNHPGILQLDWLGYRITTSFWVLAMVIMLVIIAGLFLIWAWLKLVYNISLFGSRRVIDKRNQGLDALTQLFVSLSLRDYDAAHATLARASALLGHAPLTQLLGAHIASKRDDQEALYAALEQMQEHTHTQSLAYTSLAKLAQAREEPRAALSYAKQAFATRSDNADIAHQALGLMVRNREFAEGHALLRRATRQGALSSQQRARYTALLTYAEYTATERTDSVLLKQAYMAAPHFPPAYDYITHLLESGKQRAGLRLLLKSWKAYPHPQLGYMLLHYFAEEAPASLLKRGQILLKSHPDHYESHLAMAQLAMKAQQWDMARNHLKAAMDITPYMRTYRAFAQLEELSTHDDVAAASWLKQMHDGVPDPAWQCDVCDDVPQHWATHCRQCGSFDSYRWNERVQGAVPPATSLLSLHDI